MDSIKNGDASKDNMSSTANTPLAESSLKRPLANDENPHEPKRARQEDETGSPSSNSTRARPGKDMGRGEYFKWSADRRGRQDDKSQVNTRETKETPIYQTSQFTIDEIKNESKRPKRKVAVLIGYSGSGYRGMQIMPDQPTIEGDLFKAFVAAGAISKANADDPKKSSLVRCARTDKGVHAAGNVISLKLIIEDEDILDKINTNLPPQIRVWGIQRTNSSFSCYTACDSRWYEYLIPSYAFLPPHPSSFLAKRIDEIAKEDGELEALQKRLEDVIDFWAKTDEQYIGPLLDQMDPEIQELAKQALYKTETTAEYLLEADDEASENDDTIKDSNAIVLEPQPSAELDIGNEALMSAIKSLKAAYVAAKKDYRISPYRLGLVQNLLSQYQGTQNFHNFTIQKNPDDPSAKRYIKSFQLNPEPIIINNTEWLSMKVHGSSFMMHQIRKMVGLVSLMVRCGTPMSRMKEALSSEVIINIPKAPSLGLLLERPVFDVWNKKAKTMEHEREGIDFGKYDKEILEFKQREIYNRIYAEEEESNIFHAFFSQIDNFKDPTFLYLTTRGIEACGDISHRPSAAKTDFKSRRRPKGLKPKREWEPRDERDTKRLDLKQDTKVVDDVSSLPTDPMASIQASVQANIGAAEVAKNIVAAEENVAKQEKLKEREQAELNSLPTDPLASITSSIQANENAAKTAANFTHQQ